MTKKDLQTVRDALKILENEFQEEENELKTFLFIGTLQQAISFYDNANKHDIEVVMTESEVTTMNMFKTYTVKTSPVKDKDFNWLLKLGERITKTVKKS